MTEHSEQLKHVGDVVSLAAVIATLAAWLPPIAALVSIVWTLIRIYETETCTRFIAWLRSR